MLSLNDLLQSGSFRRWAEGKANRQEALIWDEWCRRSERNRQLAIRAQTLLVKVKPVLSEQQDAEQEWRKLHSRINSSVMQKVKSGSIKRPVTWWPKVAAIILVAVLTVFFVRESNYWQKEKDIQEKVVWKHVETAYGEQKTISLSEGSSIILNANSSLKYPDGWIQDRSIEVHLRGEAYFDVTQRLSDVAPSFNVKTKDGTVQVMGTRFVVNAEEKRTRVVLEEGSVQIVKAQSGNKESTDGDKIRLRPNQLAEFSRKNDSVIIQEVNPEIYTSWIKNILLLEQTSFSFVVNKIKKTFGVEVKVEDPRLYERRLTGSVNFGSLEALTKAISEVLEIDVKETVTL